MFLLGVGAAVQRVIRGSDGRRLQITNRSVVRNNEMSCNAKIGWLP